MPQFPDHSAREELIFSTGHSELLYKNGVKMLRYKKKVWGTEKDKAAFERIAPFFAGRILDIGLGMGNSAEAILSRQEVAELISYEICDCVVDVFLSQHDPDQRHTIIIEDAHEYKPDGTFDVIVYELLKDSEENYDKAKAYVIWALDHLTENGCVFISHDRFAEPLAAELGSSVIVTQVSSGIGLTKRIIWLRLEKA